MHRTRNAAYGQPYRGFESLPLRHHAEIFTEDGLLLGRTLLIDRQGATFAVRRAGEIKRMLNRAYRTDLAVDRIMPGLNTVAAALNAHDPGLARIAAVHLRIPDLLDQAARDRLESRGCSYQID